MQDQILIIKYHRYYNYKPKMISSSTLFPKQNRLTLQRRLCLKSPCLQNSTSKQNMRMSIPTRRQSLSSTISQQVPLSNITHFENNRSNNRASFASCMSVQIGNRAGFQSENRKEVILNNLVKKLVSEEQLKDIIKFKMGGSLTRKSVSKEIYIIQKNNQQDDRNEAKVKNCEKQLEWYKNMLTSLMIKVSNLQAKSNFKKISMHDAATQTQPIHNILQNSENGLDFIANLDRTIKVLSGKKAK